MEMPVNLVIVVAIAVLALVVVSAFFTDQVGSGINSIEAENLYRRGCNTLKNVYSCSSFEEVKVDSYTLAELCLARGIDSSATCMKSCGCDATTDYALSNEIDRTTVGRTIFEHVRVATPS